MDLIYIGIGGVFGALTRFQLGKIMSQRINTTFPFGTFIINTTGALLLGMLSALNPGNNVYLLLGDGFLGAYTTFSSFIYEGFNLFRGSRKLNAAVYIFCSVILGIAGYISGYLSILSLI